MKIIFVHPQNDCCLLQPQLAAGAGRGGAEGHPRRAGAALRQLRPRQPPRHLQLAAAAAPRPRGQQDRGRGGHRAAHPAGPRQPRPRREQNIQGDDE